MAACMPYSRITALLFGLKHLPTRGGLAPTSPSQDCFVLDKLILAGIIARISGALLSISGLPPTVATQRALKVLPL